MEIADINKNVMGVAESNVEMVNVNHEFGDREEGQALDDKQEHNKISIFEVGHFDFLRNVASLILTFCR